VENWYRTDAEQLKETIDALRQQLAHSTPTVDDTGLVDSVAIS